MPLAKVSVSQSELQKLFNRHYLPAYERGDLTRIIVRSGPPDPTANQPRGTKSEIWALHTNDGRYIGKVHVYVKPDGTLSASGKPDPKELIIGQKRYVAVKMPRKD